LTTVRRGEYVMFRFALVISLWCCLWLTNPAVGEVISKFGPPGQDGKYQYIDWSTVKGYVSIPVFFATDRANADALYDDKRSKDLSFGVIPQVIPLRNATVDPGNRNWTVSTDNVDRAFIINKGKEMTVQEIAQAPDFMESVSKAVAGSPRKILLVFVHGFDNSFADAMAGAGELAYWYGCPVIAFSWAAPKDRSGLDSECVYRETEEHVDESKRGFEHLIDMLKRDKRIGSSRLVIVGHSMGNHLLEGMLNDESASPNKVAERFREVVFCSADVDGMDFANRVTGFSTLAERIRIYYNANDRALLLSAHIHSGQPRLGEDGDHIARAVRTHNVEAIDVSDMLLGGLDHDMPDWLLARMTNKGKCDCSPDWKMQQVGRQHLKIKAVAGDPLQRLTQRTLNTIKGPEKVGK
jgi:esterase/lipase superfamily enzyme